MEDYYQILGVPQNASFEDIKKRFRYLAYAHHPDRFDNPFHKAQAAEEFKKINQAYQILSDREKRAKYDSQQANSSDAGIRTVPPRPEVSPTTLDFGTLHRKDQRTERFRVNNLGGPAREINFNYSEHDSWFKISNITRPSDIQPFPLELKVTADTQDLVDGRSYSGWIEVSLDGVTARVSLNVAIMAIPKSTPIVTPATPTPIYAPSPPPSTSTAPSPTRSASITPTLLFVLAVLVLVSICVLGFIGPTVASNRAAASTAAASATEEAAIEDEIARATSYPQYAVALTRIGDIDCNEIGYFGKSITIYPINCYFVWAEYALRNNMRYLEARAIGRDELAEDGLPYSKDINLTNGTCVPNKDQWSGGFHFVLQPKESATVFCQETHQGRSLDLCLAINIRDPQGEWLFPQDGWVCWNR